MGYLAVGLFTSRRSVTSANRLAAFVQREWPLLAFWFLQALAVLAECFVPPVLATMIVTGYLVAYGPPSNPEAQQLRVTQPTATVPKVAPGTVISVKAVNAKGLEGWDWARVSVR